MLANPAVQAGSGYRVDLQHGMVPRTPGFFLRQLPSRRAEFVSSAHSYKAWLAAEAAKHIGCEASRELSLSS